MRVISTTYYVMLTFDDYELVEAQRHGFWDWLEETNCGKKVNMRSCAFKTHQDLTFFYLRWEGILYKEKPKLES